VFVLGPQGCAAKFGFSRLSIQYYPGQVVRICGPIIAAHNQASGLNVKDAFILDAPSGMACLLSTRLPKHSLATLNNRTYASIGVLSPMGFTGAFPTFCFGRAEANPAGRLVPPVPRRGALARLGRGGEACTSHLCTVA